MSLWTLAQVFLTFVLILSLYIRKKYSYWSSRGVPGPRAIFPFGYTWDKARNDPFELETRWLSEYGKLYGVYTGLEPTLIIADPEYIRQVFIKDFQLFANRRILNSFHPVWNQNLFSVDYEQWKLYRTMTTPAFSSGKLRNMSPFIRSCIEKLFAKINSLPDGVIVPKEIFTNFSIDITSASFFATETDAHATDSTGKQNPIVRQCMALVDIPAFKSAAVGALPRPLLNLMGITSVFREEALAYIVHLLRSIVAQQKMLPPEKQNDFIRLLIQSNGGEANGESEATNASKSFKPLSDDEIIAQCLIFFLASYEQIASVMTYCAYELAQNQDIQQRLYEEILNATGDIDEAQFETAINEINYLEAIIKESLRKYPPELRMERRVSGEKGATIGGVHLEKDTLIEVPTIALHHNPQFFPNPQMFDPERFMPENRHLLVPYSFIPFGEGPRNCIGTRFAYQVVKACLAWLLVEYRVEVAEGTPKKLGFISGNLSLLIPKFPLQLKKR